MNGNTLKLFYRIIHEHKKTYYFGNIKLLFEKTYVTSSFHIPPIYMHVCKSLYFTFIRHIHIQVDIVLIVFVGVMSGV